MTDLFLTEGLPSVGSLTEALLRNGGVPRAIGPRQIAKALLSRVAAAEAATDALPPPAMVRPLADINSRARLRRVASRIVRGLKHLVEEQGHWRELWRGDTPASEPSCQALFKLVALSWCQPYDIDVSAETNFGRGPVDFKLSRGWKSRVLVEVKLASNTRFWRGLDRQLPQYMKSEGIERGFFVAFVFRASELKKVSKVAAVAKSVGERTGYAIEAVVIDARRDNKQSASKA